MINKYNILSVINVVMTVVFSFMSFFGLILMIEMINRSSNGISSEDLANTALFTVSSIGLITQLLLYNLKTFKK